MHINWNSLTSSIKTSMAFREWQKLKKYFVGDEDITYFDLLEYYLNLYYPHWMMKYKLINQVMRSGKIYIPPQYASYISPDLDKDVPLHEFLSVAKEICRSHSVYSYIACSLFYTQSSLALINVKNYGELFYSAPSWLKVILSRQYRLTQNAALEGDRPLFFLYRNNEIYAVSKENVKEVSLMLELGIGYSLKEYIRYFKTFRGMPHNSSMMLGSINDIKVELSSRRKRSVRSAVTIYKFKGRERIIVDHGFCVEEVEPGVYLVHGINDIYIVPFHLMDTAKVNACYPPMEILKGLYRLNYVPEEDQKEITGIGKLMKYKIVPRRL